MNSPPYPSIIPPWLRSGPTPPRSWLIKFRFEARPINRSPDGPPGCLEIRHAVYKCGFVEAVASFAFHEDGSVFARTRLSFRWPRRRFRWLSAGHHFADDFLLTPQVGVKLFQDHLNRLAVHAPKFSDGRRIRNDAIERFAEFRITKHLPLNVRRAETAFDVEMRARTQHLIRR